MLRKTLFLTSLIACLSLTADAGLNLGNVLKKPSAAAPSASNPISQNRDYTKEREQYLQKLFDDAPNKNYDALTQYFAKKLGSKPGYKSEGSAPTWFVRSYKDSATEYCALFSLSNVQSSMASTAERAQNNGSITLGSSKCDHPWTKWAPVVLDFLN